MPLAFGGILFFLVGLIAFVAIAWYVVAYLRAGVEATEDGIDPEQKDHPDAGHVAGPQDH
jgi:parvulin-like peptidyl-prolyl isomerase